jgi:hypothetical protein
MLQETGYKRQFKHTHVKHLGTYRGLRDHLLIMSILRLDRNNHVLQTPTESNTEQNLDWKPATISFLMFIHDVNDTYLEACQPRVRDILTVAAKEKATRNR